MKSGKRQSIRTIAQCTTRAGRPHCPHRRDSLTGSIRTAVDDAGSLAITVWTCASCGDLVEEIRLLSWNETARLHPMRDASALLLRRGRSPELSVVR